MSESDLFHVDPDLIDTFHELSNEDLAAFAELYNDDSDDEKTEIYIFCRLFIYLVRTRSIEELEQVVPRTEAWIETVSDGHPDRPRRLEILREIKTILARERLILEARMPNAQSPRKRIYVAEASVRAMRQYTQTHDLIDLEDAIRITNEALAMIPDQNPPQFALYLNLGAMHRMRFQHMDSIDDLNRAIEVTNFAAETVPQDGELRPKIFDNLTELLGEIYDRTKAESDIERAIAAHETALHTTTAEVPERARWLRNLSVWLGRRYEITYDIKDLDRIIDVDEMTLNSDAAAELDLASLTARWASLAYALSKRAEQKASRIDLDRSIDASRMAVQLSPDDIERAGLNSGLGNKLFQRYEWMGDEADLRHACELTELAAIATPHHHESRADSLNNLSVCLSGRFQRTGQMEDINRAIEVIEEAAQITSDDHQHRDLILNNVGKCHCARFDWTRALEDLESAIDATEKALLSTRVGGRDRAMILSNLASLFGRRFERLEGAEDLDRAIQLMDEAVNTTRSDDPDRARYLVNLGAWLGRRFEENRTRKDLDRAIDVGEIATSPTTTQYRVDRSSYLNNLGSWLYWRFEEQKEPDDLNRAIEVAHMAVQEASIDHPERASWLNNLGVMYEVRFRETESQGDFNRSVASFKEGWESKIAPPIVRIRCARRAAMLLASRSDWEASSQLLHGAVHHLPALSARSLRNTDKEDALGNFAGLASMAAAVALNSGAEAHSALKLLELGRSVIANLVLEMRTDVSDLETQYPDLAQEFIWLRNVLDASPSADTAVTATSAMISGNTISAELRGKQRREADDKFTKLLSTIRSKDDFRNFLLPPTEEEMKAAADPDPIVVINQSSYRCDAFLIERDKIQALALPDLKVSTVRKWSQQLGSSDDSSISEMLEYLWSSTASPCLERLNFVKPPVSDENWSRVWWIATGLLSQLPLHAAGRHGGSEEDEAVLDRVMSSYALSIKTLLHSRKSQPPVNELLQSSTALLVAMHETPGLGMGSNLPYANAEAAMLRKLCPSLHLSPLEPTKLCKSSILAHLPTCNIFHFAGHGHSNASQPSKSSLLLDDWATNPLTVDDLREYRLQDSAFPPFLGYLSACSTGANESAKLADEGIHLISALQFAGFRHVVGTLWEVADRYCVDVARVLYETLCAEGRTDAAVCRGLHRAVRALRGKEIEGSGKRNVKKLSGGKGCVGKRSMGYYWVPYVHYGVLATRTER